MIFFPHLKRATCKVDQGPDHVQLTEKLKFPIHMIWPQISLSQNFSVKCYFFCTWMYEKTKDLAHVLYSIMLWICF